MNNGLLVIKKRPLPFYLTIFIFAFPYLWGTLFDLLNAPSAFKYLVDFAWVGLVFFLVFKQKLIVPKKIAPLVAVVTIFFLYTLIVYLFNFQSPFYYLWGFRNNFRFFIFFFSVITFLNQDDISSILKLLDVVFWFNFVVSLVQFFVLGYEQDFLGGIFGIEKGCNNYSIIFMSIVVSRALLLYLENKTGSVTCLSKCVASLLIAALAELKFYFVVFIIIVILSAMLTSFSFKKISLIAVALVFVAIGSILLSDLFGFDNFLSFESIWDLATREQYSSEDTVNRLSAIPKLISLIVSDVKDQFFGYGLGNCDTSSFDLFNSAFYQQYGFLSYNWFSCAILFLETGYIGLLLYASFFITIIVLSIIKSKSNPDSKINCMFSVEMAVLSLILIVYNASLRSEAGFLVFFALAVPFVSGARTSEIKTVRNETVEGADTV